MGGIKKMRNMLLVKSELEIMDYHESVNKRGEYWIPGNYCLRLLRSETQLGSFFGLLEYTHTHTHTHILHPQSSNHLEERANLCNHYME